MMTRDPCERALWPPGRRSQTLLLLPLAVLSLSGCSGSEDVFEPPTLQSVIITSPADTVVGVGFTVQMTAEGIATDGLPLPDVVFTWASSNPNVAQIQSSSGSVSTLSAGSTTITATSDNIAGSLVMRVVPADVTALSSVLSDSFLSGMIAALSSTTRTSINAQLNLCNTGLASGSMLSVHLCLTTADNQGGDGSGSDTALLAVMDLYWAHALGLLNFGR